MKRIINLFILFSMMVSVVPVLRAESYDLKYMTPAVEKAIKSRQARYDEIQSLKAAGAIGENRMGYIEARTGSAAAVSVSSAENADRKVIYEAIVEQNSLAPNALGQVEQTFGAVQRDRAAAGEVVQLPDGQWVRK